jgi:predicted acyl esterase
MPTKIADTTLRGHRPHAERHRRPRPGQALVSGVVIGSALASLWPIPAPPALAAPVASVFSGRIACAPEAAGGVQFCEGRLATRIESWDGVPLDVNVTLPPASMDGPFPLVVELHGWSLGKSPAPFVDRALAGYAVLNYSARGFHGSCGSAAARAPDAGLSDPDACATRGWTHLADARYEARDTQHLAGLLADENVVVPDRIAVTGASYGGGQSMILAALRDRVMLPDGALVPWKSPAGHSMRIAAAAALIPWTDFAAALTPNGATLDHRALNPYGGRAGVSKQGWTQLLYAVGAGSGFYAPAGVDPGADITGWNARLAAGEPYDADAAVQQTIAETTSHHSAYYIDDSVAPAPLFIYNAWTDDLFPATEGLRFWRKIRSRYSATEAEIALHFADAFGHPRASLGGDTVRVNARVAQFLARHLEHDGPPLPAVEVYTQACGGSIELGPITAADWDGLHPGEIRFQANDEARFDGTGGDPGIAAGLGPLDGGPCRTFPAADHPNAAIYRLPPASGDGYTLLGSPTIVASLVVTGAEFAQVAGRLWDVSPDGSQALVTHDFYRPRADNLNPQVFQLAPNGWRFAPGHVAKLELVGQSSPAGRPSTGAFSVTVADLELLLPVREPPDGAGVFTPEPIVPAAGPEPPACPAAPLGECAGPTRPGAAELALASAAGKRPDRLSWKWKGTRSVPALDLAGIPAGTGGYTLCLYDGADRLRLSTAAPTSGTCGGKRCWKASRRRAHYADPTRDRTGIRKLTIKAGRGALRIKVEGQGARLGLPALPLDGPLTVQLLDWASRCYGSTFSSGD